MIYDRLSSMITRRRTPPPPICGCRLLKLARKMIGLSGSLVKEEHVLSLPHRTTTLLQPRFCSAAAAATTVTGCYIPAAAARGQLVDLCPSSMEHAATLLTAPRAHYSFSRDAARKKVVIRQREDALVPARLRSVQLSALSDEICRVLPPPPPPSDILDKCCHNAP